jgi:single-strand DNA-binding protein
MTHTVTAKLNKAARKFDNQAGSTFFVSLGEKNYDFKEKTNKWTNYDAALFAKDKQIDFYASVLVEGAILTVSGSGIIIDDSNKDYPPKLILQDAKLNFISDGQSSPTMPSQPQAQQAAPPIDDGSFDKIPF